MNAHRTLWTGMARRAAGPGIAAPWGGEWLAWMPAGQALHCAPSGLGACHSGEILQADQARYAAMVAGDWDALAHLLADALAYRHSSALTETRPQYLASLRSGRFRYQQVRTEDVQVQVYGSQTAWMQGTATLDVHIDGVARRLHHCFLTVWTRRAGHWQLASWASIPLSPS